MVKLENSEANNIFPLQPHFISMAIFNHTCHLNLKENLSKIAWQSHFHDPSRGLSTYQINSLFLGIIDINDISIFKYLVIQGVWKIKQCWFITYLIS